MKKEKKKKKDEIDEIDLREEGCLRGHWWDSERKMHHWYLFHALRKQGHFMLSQVMMQEDDKGVRGRPLPEGRKTSKRLLGNFLLTFKG